MVYAGDAYILGDKKRATEVPVYPGKEVDTGHFMLMSRHLNSGQNYYIKTR
jgi:hypothetical protein